MALKINREKIILASGSPRRKQLLQQIGMDIDICVSNVDEAAFTACDPENYVKELAWQKAKEVGDRYPDNWTIGADTIVTIDDRILEKPGSAKEAKEMLRILSNREHFVFTGFCIYHAGLGEKLIQSVQTGVTFKKLSPNEINFYVATKEPFDKAGGYGIQEKGAFLVEKIAGSYTNVVGLPLCELVREMDSLNLIEMS